MAHILPVDSTIGGWKEEVPDFVLLLNIERSHGRD